MIKSSIYWETIGITAKIASFTPENGVAEYHVMMQVEPRDEMFKDQFTRLRQGEELLMNEIDNAIVCTKRYFVSDSTNQESFFTKDTAFIQQPPLNGGKICVWLYITQGTSNYKHLWSMAMTNPQGSCYEQTKQILETYESLLSKNNASIADNCIRTWIYVRDVDTQYQGMVEARRENFIKEGLTQQTHYISSTGIQGVPANPKAIIQMDAYSILDISPNQQQYLYAASHLNPTYEYGVTFERGTKVKYGDRSHIFISGTASIDNKGNVVHVGDIVQQTLRMWDNVEALLSEGNATTNDIAQIIVYLRDIADYNTVQSMFDDKFPNTPIMITQAPVCRPTWLIEMECIAITEEHNEEFRNF